MKTKLILTFLFIFLINSYTQRGRVQIQDGTLVTDKGTLLRGAYTISQTDYNQILARDYITQIKKLGLNCIHVYAESYGDNIFPAGYQHQTVDSLVKWTEEDSLYLILSTTGHNSETLATVDFIVDFWKFYAQRYINKTHLIYEIVNEPYLWSSPYDSQSLDMERRAYDTIRSCDPQVHIQLMSFACINNINDAIADIRKLGGGIDWNKTSISIHGYCGSSSEDMRKFIRTFQDSGFAVFDTEIPCIEDYYTNRYANLAFTRVFEEEFVSYIHFLPVETILNEPKRFKTLVESSELRWNPEFGDWPASLTSINYLDPYQIQHAAFFDAGGGIHNYENFSVWCIFDGAWMGFYNYDFQESPDSLIVKCSSENSGSEIEFHLDSVDGPIIARCPLINSGRYNILRYACPIDEIEGVHDIFIVFNGYTSIMESFTFKRNNETSIIPFDMLNKQDMKIYPNPANDYLTIKSANCGDIEIYSMQGQLLLKQEITNSEQIISTEFLKPGNYIVRLVSQYNTKSEILIIK